MALRKVLIRVTGNVNFFGNLGTATVADNIKAALRAQGWNIEAVVPQSFRWVPLERETFLITANVGTQYSASDIEINMTQHLSGVLSNIDVTANAQKGSGETLNDDAISQIFGDDPFGLKETKDDATKYILIGGVFLVFFMVMQRR